MGQQLRIKFNPNQDHQRYAIESTVKLFEGLRRAEHAFQLGDEIIPNLSNDQTLDEVWLLDNLREIQQEHNLPENATLECDEGMVLEGAGNESWRYPTFTIQMETGTGKTYVYLRSIHELKKQYGFRKFMVVVPSIAIYEGFVKSFEITKEHFKTLYGNEVVHLTQYDGSQISKLRGFATSTFTEVLVLTIDSFNDALSRSKNVIFKGTDKLPGERLPIQFLQETRPILILDEPQNYTSELSKAALRTLHPLLAFSYSATPREKPNLIYNLSPVDAFTLGLVKRIEVFGVTERYNENPEGNEVSVLGIQRQGRNITATLGVVCEERGQRIVKEVKVNHGDDLYAKTKNSNYTDVLINNIDYGDGKVEFSDGSIIHSGQNGSVLSKEEIFRWQISKTIETHFERQKELRGKGIKVLSLFFIDRVANYVEKDGVIRRLFAQEFDKFKVKDTHFKKHKADDVCGAYFAKRKDKKGDESFVDIEIEDGKRKKEERELEKIAYDLIMKDKEKLLSFDEKVSFIFAHSALKEGWDNPNVFQICTLNQTYSEPKKRQEVGRGLRLCVDQKGERISDEFINILTVVCNESYEEYVGNLQRNYVEDGDAAPPAPTKAHAARAKRNNVVFASQEFKSFWAKLCQETSYDIKIDADSLVRKCVDHFNNVVKFPEPQVVITKGRYVITTVRMTLRDVKKDAATISILIATTEGESESFVKKVKKGDDLRQITNRELLRGFKVLEIKDDPHDPAVEFADRGSLSKSSPIEYASEKGQRVDERKVETLTTRHPVFNLIDRAARELTLTRGTILRIFKGIKEEKKKHIFKNPESFAGIFINVMREILADHIAENISYSPAAGKPGHEIGELFPIIKNFPQKELVDGAESSLYDKVQIDSNVEKRFVSDRLNIDDKIICYFKFPPQFKIKIPKLIGNYNPDWGIVRRSEDGKIKLQLVRETKGSLSPQALQFPNEKRKLSCGTKHFKAIGIDYRQITDAVEEWWQSEDASRPLLK